MGRDKATLVLASGLTVVARTVEVLATRCEPVFVIAAPGQALPVLGGAQVLRDELRDAGPLPATGIGLRAAAAAGCERAFVCAVDMPGLEAELIDDLVCSRDADVVLPFDGRDHYLAGVYRSDLAGRVEALVAGGERRMKALIDAVRTRRIVVDNAKMLTNVNTPSPD